MTEGQDKRVKISADLGTADDFTKFYDIKTQRGAAKMSEQLMGEAKMSTSSEKGFLIITGFCDLGRRGKGSGPKDFEQTASCCGTGVRQQAGLRPPEDRSCQPRVQPHGHDH